MADFKMGKLDHMHLMVPDRYEAARWYRETLGFEIVEEYEEWARVKGGPLHISADGGQSGLALFEDGGPNAGTRISIGVAFSVEPAIFVAFANILASLGLRDPQGQELTSSSVVDHDLCYAFYFNDPYGNTLELDCYDHAAIERDLIEQEGITPVRFW